ncbi:phycoerythrobilin:ferredoxin oxidoreductase [Prochlorococcus marinus]|uniref:phycoerythrobilin:ferredoxin oxidoreductase n=1 Tax=Prochlorococcus marinus TaxID=1219 RepID=UPI0022B53061|nr:phycoerythrobilin:ferredoxin oxidoreductase [Prochlorococcus marinus]
MQEIRVNSLSPLHLPQWRWAPFLSHLEQELSVLDIEPYPIPKDFLYRKVLTGTKLNPFEVTTSTWASKTKKIRLIRAACLQAGKGSDISVFNLLINPFHQYDLPFFGADFVTLPNGHLLALDLQPALKMDDLHTRNVWPRLIPLHERWQSLLPDGGPLPKDAEPFFSPGFLWTRLPLDQESDLIISNILQRAFKEYLSLYLELIQEAEIVSEDRSRIIFKGQKSYFDYRATKDPARSMLTRFYGKKWTEEYIHQVLFKI